MTKIYISGRIGSGPDRQDNMDKMNYFAEMCRRLHPTVEFINPLDLNEKNSTWHEAMKKDIIALCDCDGIIMMSGWEVSPGAHFELHIAHRVGIRIYLGFSEFRRGYMEDAKV